MRTDCRCAIVAPTPGRSKLRTHGCCTPAHQIEATLKQHEMHMRHQHVKWRTSAASRTGQRAADAPVRRRICNSEFSAARCHVHQCARDGQLSAGAISAEQKNDHPSDGNSHFQRSDTGSLGKSCKRPVQVGMAALALGLASVAITPPAHASIAEAVAASLRDIAPDWLVVFVLASLPVVELRGAVPVGISILGLSPPFVYFLAVMGNMVPVPLILFGLQPLVKASAGVPPLYRLLEGILERARKQTKQMDRDTIFMGLAYFVAVPLPGTGAWSGAIAAFVLDVPFWPAVMSNFAGVCCAGALVTMLTCMGWMGLWLAIIILLLVPLLSFLVKSMKSDPK